MAEAFFYVFRRILVFIGYLVSRLLLRLTVIGWENLPKEGSLIVISNHFSWFDAPLLTAVLPFQPAFLIATESQKRWFVRFFTYVFEGIPIWRGQVDRGALRKALDVLHKGGVLGIFPEGGIDPEMAQVVARGETVDSIYDHASRHSAQLTRPRMGTALLAVKSQARILPIGLLGTEKIFGNLLRFRRTDVTVLIGQPFGPLTLDQELHGKAKRQRLRKLADMIMQRIAALFPPEHRGPYRKKELETP